MPTMLRAPFLLLVFALLVAGTCFIGPARAQSQMCDALDTVFGDLVNNKLRNINTKKKDSHGDWIARVSLPDMDSCIVDQDMIGIAYICVKRIAERSELDAMFVRMERVIGECFSGFKVSRESNRMGDSVSWSPGGTNSISLTRSPVFKRLRITVLGF